MKRLVLPAVALALGFTWGAAPALAWNCPVQLRTAEQSIKKAEAMKLSPEAKALVDEAKKLVVQSKGHHSDAHAKIDHANAMWKAKAAAAQADSAAAISTP